MSQGRDGIISTRLSAAFMNKLQELNIRRKSIAITRSIASTCPKHAVRSDAHRAGDVPEAVPHQAAGDHAALWDLDALFTTKRHGEATIDGLNAIAPSNSNFEPSLSILRNSPIVLFTPGVMITETRTPIKPYPGRPNHCRQSSALLPDLSRRDPVTPEQSQLEKHSIG